MDNSNHAMEGWEWENIFTSSLLEQDIIWHSEFDEPHSTVVAHPTIHPSGSSCPPNEKVLPGSDNGIDSYTTAIASSAMNATNTSNGSLESRAYDQETPVSSYLLQSEISIIDPSSSGIFTEKKKRDPRLGCPNFRAGRVPCSCPEEDELEEDIAVDTLVKKKRKVARCQVPSCGGDISHLKGYHQHHRVCLACANSCKVMLKDQPHRYCQQCGKFHRLSDFDEGKRSCRRKLEKHNRRRRRHLLEEGEFQVSSAPQLEVHKVEPVQKDTRQKAKDPVTEDRHESDDPYASITRLEQEVMSFDESQFDERALPTMLMGSAHEGVTDSITKVPKQLPTSKAGFPKATGLSNNKRRCPDYLSPCPTGRISFKLYDWNPADFPRRLRQQIFQWLASMPVELESYVRSGCIIVTFFITMPLALWDQVLDGWIAHVQTCIRQSKAELRGTSQLVTQMKETTICLKSGTLLSGDKRDVGVPFLVDIYPRSLEAGCHTLIYVCGFNISRARLFISFGDQYTECNDWESVEHDHCSHQAAWNSIDNLEFQKATIFLPNTQKCGVAFVEVDSDYGVSNFMSLLVAGSAVCSEINAFGIGVMAKYKANMKHDKAAKATQYDPATAIVADLGWAFKYMNRHHHIDQAEVMDACMSRLNRLLDFFLEHGCHAVVEKLVQSALNTITAPVVDHLSGSRGVGHVSKSAKDLLTQRVAAYLHQEPSKLAIVSDKEHICAADSPNKTKGSRSAFARFSSATVCLHYEDVENDISNFPKDESDMKLPLLEERISIPEDEAWQKRGCWAQPLGWARKPLTTLVLGVGNRRFYRVVIEAVSVVTVCTGMCFMLQHPQEVVEISMSIRRCLWAANGSEHV